jgi:hypothetical protein
MVQTIAQSTPSYIVHVNIPPSPPLSLSHSFIPGCTLGLPTSLSFALSLLVRCPLHPGTIVSPQAISALAIAHFLIARLILLNRPMEPPIPSSEKWKYIPQTKYTERTHAKKQRKCHKIGKAAVRGSNEQRKKRKRRYL